MDRQEIQECFLAVGTLSEVARDIQAKCIRENRDDAEFDWISSLRYVLGALRFALHRRLLGGGCDSNILSLVETVESVLSERVD